ncbi:Plasmodium exported protein (PHISTb), unknown function [Plasmodium sp.]|nr:Plasmodium exported protein (PHISTb), unknown function [Plasmodium sp.]
MGKPFLFKSLLCKHYSAPIIGLVYVIVLTVGIFYQGDFYSFNSELNKRCSRKLYHEACVVESERAQEHGKLYKLTDLVNNGEGYLLKEVTREESENSNNDIFKNYKTLFNNLSQYEKNKFSDKSDSMVFNEKDNQIYKKIELLKSDNDNIRENMKSIWMEVMGNERRKYDNLRISLYNFYNDLKRIHKVPKTFAEEKWQECNEIILIGGQNMETYIDNIFYDWIDNKNNLNINEFKIIVNANRFAWKKLNENVKSSCEGILNKTFEAKLKGKELHSKFIVDMYKQIFDNAIKRSVLKNKGLKRKLNGANYLDSIRNAPFIDIDASDDLDEEIEYHHIKGNDKHVENEKVEIGEDVINSMNKIDDLEYEKQEYSDKYEKKMSTIYHESDLEKSQNNLNYLKMNLLNLKKLFDDLDINFSDIKMDFSDIDNKFSDIDINYDDLNVDLTDLQNDFSKLPIDFNDLQIDYNDLSIDFNNLPIDFNDISIDFNDVHIDFNDLPIDFTNLNIDYGGLEIDYINPGANISEKNVQYVEPNINDSNNELFYSDVDYEGTEPDAHLSEHENIITTLDDDQ